MAQPITWRSLIAPNQSDALGFNRQGSQQIQSGLGGLSSLAKTFANDLDEDQLNTALAEINSLGTVDAARKAQENDFVSTLGLNAEQQLKARNALGNQLNSNITRTNGLNTFDANQLALQEAPIRDQLDRAIANKDFELAKTLTNNLSDGGSRVGEVIQGQETLTDKENFERFTNSLIDVNFNNPAQKQQALLGVQLDSNLNEEQKVEAVRIINSKIGVNNQIKGIGQDAEFQKFLDVIPSGTGRGNGGYDQLLLGLNAENFTPQQKNEAINIINNQRNSDPSVRQENALSTINKEIAQLKLNNQLKQNPVDPALTPQANLTLESVFEKFKPLTQTAEGWFDYGVGNYDEFKKAANTEINKGWTDSKGNKQSFNPVVIEAALNNTQAVQEAVNEGNLGDYFGDNIDEDDFITLLELYQAKYNENITRDAANLEAQIQFARGN